MANSPTSRTLQVLRSHDVLAQVVERWNPHARVRQDLFGFIDILAVNPMRTGCLGIQATSGSNMASRVAKVVEHPHARVFLEAQNSLQVWGWRQLKIDGRPTWRARIQVVYLATDSKVRAGDPLELEQLLL
jgi:hypothetical protein